MHVCTCSARMKAKVASGKGEQNERIPNLKASFPADWCALQSICDRKIRWADRDERSLKRNAMACAPFRKALSSARRMRRAVSILLRSDLTVQSADG